MVTCVCGKNIEKIPDWLQGVQADFVCNNCPNRQTKNIAVMSAEIDQRIAGGLKAAVLETTDEEPVDEEEE